MLFLKIGCDQIYMCVHEEPSN